MEIRGFPQTVCVGFGFFKGGPSTQGGFAALLGWTRVEGWACGDLTGLPVLECATAAILQGDAVVANRAEF